MATRYYARYIDGLRAVAVLSVIFYHLNARLIPGGFVGVDVFFVISGFVVSASVRELEGVPLSEFLGYFYARRLFRIAPALVICLLVTALATALLVPFAWLSGTNQKTGSLAFFGLSNFILANTNDDYFSPRVEFNPFTHTWSLGVEEQFYLLFPWLFFGWLHGWRRLSAAVVVAGFGLSIVLARHFGAVDPGRTFYLVTSRFWELAAGVLLFQGLAASGQEFGKVLPESRLANAGAVASAIVLGVGLAVARPSSTPFPGGILPVLGTVGLIGFLQGRQRGGAVLRVLEHALARFFGKISYSLYLWHWPVFVLFRWTVGLQGMTEDVVALAIILGLSLLSWRFVEIPPRRALAASALPRGAAVGIGLAALLLGFGVMKGIWALQPEISLSTVTQHAMAWYPDGVNADPAVPGCRVAGGKARIGPGLLWSYARTGCDAPVLFSHRLFVIGDSHAAAYVAMAKLLTLQTGATVYFYGTGGCSFIGLLNMPVPGCAAFQRAAVADILRRLRPGDVVFLPSLRIPRFVDQFVIYGEAPAREQMFGPQVAAARQAGIAAAIPVLQAFASKGAKVVFEAPTPEFDAPAFRCADWFDRGNPICAGGTTVPRATLVELRAPVIAAFAKFARAVPGVAVWDPLPVLCPGDVCASMREGQPLFFDGDHLSGHGDAVLLPSFERFLGIKK